MCSSSDRPSNRSLVIFTAAKLNLFLQVGPKRASGYHDLQTVYQSIDLFDELKLDSQPPSSAAQKEISLQVVEGLQSHLLPTDKDNLIYKAAKLFYKAAQVDHYNLRVHLKKNIPVGAGLAGGSSNAAGVLYALNHLHGQILSQDELLELARHLGSDVPFCLLGGRMIGTGRGDQLIRLPINEELAVLLLFPPSDLLLSSQEIYRRFDESNEPNFRPKVSFEKFVSLLSSGRTEARRTLHNSLETAVLGISDWSRSAKAAIEAEGHYGLVSGSGPSVFAVVPGEIAALNLQEKLNGLGYRSGIFRGIDRSFELISHH